ncbi:hypothetical protein [Phenylobacterium sp.]|jgi:hypothetical protein|uniref:hypothetical protein n=1 Tax=Phenylobacterium sp. TaxID=1871053 RepID=UPI002F94DA53
MIKPLCRAAIALLAAASLGSGLVRAQPAGPPAEDRTAVEAGLLTMPVYVVMKQHYPETYAKIVEVITRGMATGRPMAAIQGEARAIYLDLVKAQSPRADPRNLLESIDIATDQAETLVDDPRTCLGLLGVQPMEIVAQEVLSSELAARELAWGATLLKQTAERPYRPNPGVRTPDAATMEALAIAAYDGLPSDDSRKRFMALGGDFSKATDSADQRVGCEFTIGFLRNLQKRPPEEAAEIIRGF